MALAYLLSPTFQVENSAGKPATGGWIETFVSGSRDPYYCYSDFQGTLHPFKIPLDSLGSNVVLADDGQAYDVYVYNRYGGLLMSRYNVKPGHGAGGGGGTITSSDGSIDVTMTPTGYDLKVNGQEASALRAGANDLTSDGQFVFYELVRDGDHVTVDTNGKIRLEDGWYHYDVTARVKWEDGVTVANTENHVQLYTTLNSDIIPFDCSYEHEDTLHLHGQVKITTSGSQFVVGVQGIEPGMSIELVDCGLFAITGHGDAAEYEAGDGIIIDDHEISIDPETVQEKLTAGDNIQISEENVISATDTTYTAGTGLELDGTEFSVDTTVIQGKLTAGDNITITNNVISATAAPQEQSDWTETDTSDVSYIKNKPGVKPVVAGEHITITEGSNAFTISATVDPQVQADWTESDSSDPSYIQHKPDLSVYATGAELTAGLATKQDVISDLATIRSGAALGATAIQPFDLATVATTGDYDDLSDKPDLSVYATGAELTSGLATKQDVISDLATIRSGAALGATSVQPADLSTVATTGDYDDLSDKPDLSVYATGAELTSGLATKQDVISDLSDIRSGASLGETAVQPSDLATVATTGSYDDLTDKPVIPAAQVQADWDESDTTSKAYIQNKPDLSVYATDSELTAGLATKQDTISDLSDIRSGAALGETAVQPSDLSTVATTGDYDDLSDKPDLSVYATGAELTAGLATKQDTISDLATIRSGAAAGATAIQPSDLATVATTGDYDDLTDKPDLSIYAESSNLATVATSGSYDDLVDKPTIPAAQVNSDWNASSGVAEILNKPTLSTVATTGDYDDLIDKPDLSIYAETANLATVATTGDYDDLVNKPTIPAAQVNSDWNSNSGVSQILNKPTLSTVATTGDYDDLINKPSIPAAQVNADWNSSSGVSAILNKPTLAAVATSGDYADLSGTPTINNVPAVTSSDDNKVLKASYTGGVGSYSWENETGTTYSAGTGIDIDQNNAISVENPLPSSTSADEGKVLKVDANGAPAWAVAQSATVDQTYNAASTNAQSGTAVAGALATVDEVPAVTSSDDDKVLKASYSGGVGSYSWEAEPAILGIVAGSNVTITEGVSDITIAATDTTYTAGDGIAIASNTVSADVDGTTIGIDSTTKKIKLLSTIPTVPTAGNMLSVTNDTLNVTTTAGITDIQQVASLPANPVSTVLYLIPET